MVVESRTSASSNADRPIAVVSRDLPVDFVRIIHLVTEDSRVKRLSENTTRNRVFVVGRLLHWLSARGVTEFTGVSPDDLKPYIAEDTRGRNTVAASCNILRYILRMLNRTDLVSAIPPLAFKFEDNFEVLNEDDIARMMRATKRLQWQLRLLMLWETGARVGEICSIRIKDVKVDNYGATVVLRGKTGTRSRRLIKCVKLLEVWLREHPWRSDPVAPLFYAERGKRCETMKPSALRHMMAGLAKRAGIEKKVWVHLVRHSAATSEASDFTDAELEELYGWVKGSGMPKRYRHKIDAKKLELKQLRLAGIQIPEEEMRSPLAPRICPRCSEQNTPLARFCSRCNMILDQKLAREIQAREDKAKSILNVLVEDPEFFDLMVQKIREKGLDQG